MRETASSRTRKEWKEGAGGREGGNGTLGHTRTLRSCTSGIDRTVIVTCRPRLKGSNRYYGKNRGKLADLDERSRGRGVDDRPPWHSQVTAIRSLLPGRVINKPERLPAASNSFTDASSHSDAYNNNNNNNNKSSKRFRQNAQFVRSLPSFLPSSLLLSGSPFP